MEKEKFIYKLNIKDYSNELEKILDKKTFSEDAKNLLLSMIYKIENSYNDYKTANVDVRSKKEILEEILKTINKDCDNIEIVKNKKNEVIYDDKKIISYLNAKKILYDIYELQTAKFKVPKKYKIIKEILEDTLNQGYSISNTEIIRDFDGWSWNILINEIENIKANLIYQILKILVGEKFLIEWRNNTSNEDYIQKMLEKLDKKYGTEISEKAIKLICQICILNISENNIKQKEELIKVQEELQQEFDIMQDKDKYLENLANLRKDVSTKIKNIDETINNDRKLKKEFISRNELLDMEHRIFSLSDFVDVLLEERGNLINELNQYSSQMKPLNFMQARTELENKLNIIKELDLKKNSNKIYNTKVKELLELTNKALEIQINNAEERGDIRDLVYKIRYYRLIYINENKQIREAVKLDKIQELAITKACKLKLINIFSLDIKDNYKIIKNIFDTDIIELSKIQFKFINKKEGIFLEIYDEKNIYKTIELSAIKELNIKFNKKYKIII